MAYGLPCTTGAAVALTSASRLYLWVGVQVTVSATGVVRGEVGVEGTLGGAYDSWLTVPLPGATDRPSLTALTPAAGPLGPRR